MSLSRRIPFGGIQSIASLWGCGKSFHPSVSFAAIDGGEATATKAPILVPLHAFAPLNARCLTGAHERPYQQGKASLRALPTLNDPFPARPAAARRAARRQRPLSAPEQGAKGALSPSAAHGNARFDSVILDHRNAPKPYPLIHHPTAVLARRQAPEERNAEC